jgi:hypothetical protein
VASLTRGSVACPGTLGRVELHPVEAKRRAEATERLLAEMGAGELSHDFWNHPTYQKLDGRTPTEALADGDEATVREVIADGYEASEQSAEEHLADPAFRAMIQSKQAEIRSRTGMTGSSHSNGRTGRTL